MGTYCRWGIIAKKKKLIEWVKEEIETRQGGTER